MDIRDEASVFYGKIQGALWIPVIAELFQEKGFDAYSLQGGYYKYLAFRMQRLL